MPKRNSPHAGHFLPNPSFPFVVGPICSLALHLISIESFAAAGLTILFCRLLPDKNLATNYTLRFGDHSACPVPILA
jgi:hypothetical protein